jgi:peptidylprolyl isomerase
MKSCFGKYLVCLTLLCLTGCTDGGKTGGKFGTMPPSDISKSFTASDGKIITMPSGIKYEDIKVGTGAEAEAGKTIHVHYTCYMLDGTVADSSLKRGQPYGFKLGTASVIKGWDLGLVGMKEGGKRKLLVPSEFAYGTHRYGIIPPGSDLIFEVELLKVDEPGKP